MKNHSRILIYFVLSLVLLTQVKILPQSLSYKVSGKIIIGGANRWDYLATDTVMHRLYVAHMNEVNVIDLATNKIAGTISGLSQVHGIAFAYESGKGFITNGGDSSVTVFDLKSLKKTANIKVTGKDPDAIVYDSFTKRIFTFNGRSKNSTAIDAKTNKVVGTVALQGNPEFAVSNGKGKMFVNLEDKDAIQEFNPKTLKVTGKWSVLPGKSPAGLAIDVKNNVLFAGCRNKLMAVVSAETGKLLTTLPIGKGNDACKYDPVNRLAFSSSWDGTITVIKEEPGKKFKVIDNIKTLQGARTMAVDNAMHSLYTATMLEGKDNPKSFGILIINAPAH